MAELTTAPASQDATSGAPQPSTQPASPKGDKPSINLHELPEFRQAQAAYERQIAAIKQELATLKTAGMDDFEKLQYEKQQLQEQLQAIQSEQARRTALEAIAREAGVPVSAIETANDPDEAWRLAVKALREGGATAAEVAAVAPPVDVGGGGGNTPTRSAEAEFRRALDARDPVAYVRAVRKMQK